MGAVSRVNIRGLLVMLTTLVLAGNGLYAATLTSTANVSVTVNSVFNLTVDTVSLDFGSVKPGEFKEIPSSGAFANSVICRSNTGNEWKLDMKTDGPMTFGAYRIPASNIKWLSTYAGNNNPPYDDLSSSLQYPPALGYQSFSDGTAFLIYTAGRVSSFDDTVNLPLGTILQFKYALQVPDDLPAGQYSTTITYTMYE